LEHLVLVLVGVASIFMLPRELFSMLYICLEATEIKEKKKELFAKVLAKGSKWLHESML
jgi:hypothetical protein